MADLSISSADTLRPDFVKLHVGGATAPDALAELHREIAGSAGVIDPALFLSELLARQSLGGNCLDQDIALPHVRTKAVNRIVLAMGRSERGVVFDPDHRQIRLILLIGVPRAATTEYLRWVSGIARRLRTSGVRQALLGATSLHEFNEAWANTS